MPDATANRIIEDIIVPRFRSGDFYGGIDAGVDAMIKVIDGEPLPPPEKAAAGTGSWQRPGPVLAGDRYACSCWWSAASCARMFGRLPAAALIGGGAASSRGLLLSSLVVAGIAGLLAFIFTLSGGTPRHGPARRRRLARWWLVSVAAAVSGVAAAVVSAAAGGGFGGGGASGRW